YWVWCVSIIFCAIQFLLFAVDATASNRRKLGGNGFGDGHLGAIDQHRGGRRRPTERPAIHTGGRDSAAVDWRLGAEREQVDSGERGCRVTSATPGPFRELARPDWLPQNQWPFQSFAVEMHSGVLAVTDAGSGPTLLLVHAGTWSFIWRDLVSRLMADFRCIFFDAPGNGQSRDVAKSATLEGASRAVAAVID